MATREDLSEEVRQLKRTLRDLVDLSILPAAWIGHSLEGIADSLADVMIKTLSLDLIYIRLQATVEGDLVEVVHGSDQTDVQAQAVYQVLAPWVNGDTSSAPTSIANPIGSGSLRIAVTRFGHTGQLGVLVAGSQRLDFPTEAERLLLGVGANQTAMVIQRKHAEAAVRQQIAERLQAEESLRESQQRLASLVESSHDAIVSKSLKGIIQSWNPSAERLFGYTAEQAIGRHISLLIPPDRIDEEDLIIARIAAGERVEHFDTVRVRSDGQTVQVSLTISPIKDAAGRVIGASKIARDITDRKALEEQLRQTLAELAEADRRKSEFLALLAHELRNPLAPISNAVQILRLSGGGDAQAVQATTEMMERQVGQLSRLVEDLLDVSRISQGKFECRMEQLELAPVVNQAVETARPRCEAEGHVVTATLPPEPIFLNGDPTRLVQVVGNLLNNACKFTPRGGRISLTLGRAANQAVIRVRDTGIGIAADHIGRIFEMFTQVDPTLERSTGGLGIGLTLVKNLVEMHGGSVEAHSGGVGRGSEFVVRLPILAYAPAPPAEPSASTSANPARRRILVVDDNKDSARSLATLLTLTGNDAHVAHDGIEALEAAANFKPEIMLLDIGLPKLNGFEVCRRIREQPWGKGIVIAALTGWGQEADRRRSREAGFDHHLVKPIEMAALKKLVESLRS